MKREFTIAFVVLLYLAFFYAIAFYIVTSQLILQFIFVESSFRQAVAVVLCLGVTLLLLAVSAVIRATVLLNEPNRAVHLLDSIVLVSFRAVSKLWAKIWYKTGSNKD